MSSFRDRWFEEKRQQLRVDERRDGRTLRRKQYRCWLVAPAKGFQPKNWKSQPDEFEIIEELPAPKFLGRADAWRFLFNSAALRNDDTSRWLIVRESPV